jgi:hypothetical protein
LGAVIVAHTALNWGSAFLNEARSVRQISVVRPLAVSTKDMSACNFPVTGSRNEAAAGKENPTRRSAIQAVVVVFMLL